MNIDIISVGTELLLGDIVNTNAQYLSKELSALGINVYRQMTVGDNMDRLLKAFEYSFKDADIILTTGGLGPTTDDITKEGAAKYFGQDLVLHEPSWKIIEEMCSKFSGGKDKIPANNKKQAMFPVEAKVIPNSKGTAPGAIFEKDGKKIIVMPGPPREMKAMFRESVLPYLIDHTDRLFKSRYIRLFGIGESALELKILDILNEQTNPTVALYAKEGEVLIRLTARAKDDDECERLLDEKFCEINDRCSDYIYLVGDDTISSTQTELDRVVADLLLREDLSLAVAESCTGGMVTSSLIDHSGISRCLLEGCVTYSNQAKVKRLGVSQDTLDKYGAVSEQTAIEMARGVATSLGADIGVSTTGIAGPGGGSEEKPVGLVYIGIYVKGKTYAIKRIFTGDRARIRRRATNEALNQVRKALID